MEIFGKLLKFEGLRQIVKFSPYYVQPELPNILGTPQRKMHKLLKSRPAENRRI